MPGTGNSIGLPEAHKRLLRWCFEEIPPTGTFSNFSFTEDEITGKEQEFSEEDTPVRSWKRYFYTEGNSKYYIDKSNLVEVWAESLDQFDEPDIISVNTDDNTPTVTVSTNNRGEVIFELYFDPEELLKSAPELSGGKFLVWFVEPETGDTREGVYPWDSVIHADFWDEITSLLIENQHPPSGTICQLNSHAVEQNFDGVKDSVKVFIDKYGATVLNQPQLNSHIQKADSEIDLSSVDFAAEIDDKEHLLVCECSNVSSEVFHVHLVKDGTVIPPEDGEDANNILTDSHKKARRFTDLYDSANVSRDYTKLAGLIVGLVFVPLVPDLLNFLTQGDPLIGTQANQIYNWIGGLSFIFAILLFGYILLPLARYRWFSWDSPKVEDRVDRLENSINSKLSRVLDR